MSAYLVYLLMTSPPGAKTKKWRVESAQRGDLLGEIRWFGRWRQYTFFPAPGTTFNQDCLRSIATWCQIETTAHRNARKRARIG